MKSGTWNFTSHCDYHRPFGPNVGALKIRMPKGSEHQASHRDTRAQELYWGIRLANGSILPPPTDTSRIDPRFYLPGSSLVPVPWPPTAIALPWTARPQSPRGPPPDPSPTHRETNRTRSPPPPIKVPPRRSRPARALDLSLEDITAFPERNRWTTHTPQDRTHRQAHPTPAQSDDRRSDAVSTSQIAPDPRLITRATQRTRIPLVYRWEPFRRHSDSNSASPNQGSAAASSLRWARRGDVRIKTRTTHTSSTGGPSASGSRTSWIAFAESIPGSSYIAYATRSNWGSSLPSSPRSTSRHTSFRGHSEDRCTWHPGTLHRLRYQLPSQSPELDPAPRRATASMDPPRRLATLAFRPLEQIDRARQRRPASSSHLPDGWEAKDQGGAASARGSGTRTRRTSAGSGSDSHGGRD